MQLIGRRYDTAQAITIKIAEGKIADVQPLDDSFADAEQVAGLPWVAPGFVDLQVNGYGGQEFAAPNLTRDHVRDISLAMDRDGVTSYFPTVTTHSFDVIQHALATIAAACQSIPEVARRVPGIHLEGPYLSREDGPRGAHPLAHCRPPDWEEFCRFQEAAQGRIRILTLSPEYPGAAEFISRAVASGVVVAIGHTAANSQQIQAAVDAGARFSTHLGNGSHRQLPRHHNYIWDQLADDRLWASLIVDGHHLPPAVVKTFVRAKTPARCLLVSDITGMAGMPPGVYTKTSLGEVEVLPGGKLVVAGQRELLAGASLPIGVGVANLMRFAGVDRQTAVEMATVRPAELVGLTTAGFELGDVADFVVFDLPGAAGEAPVGELTVKATLNAGEVVHFTL